MSKELTKEEIGSRLSAMKQDLNMIASKIGELESERDEHQMVIDTISKMEPDRTCFRLVGGVLVERTVKEVLPSVGVNMEGIRQVIAQLTETYKKKDDMFNAFQKEHNITIRSN